jgi:hypothetical protein
LYVSSKVVFGYLYASSWNVITVTLK